MAIDITHETFRGHLNTTFRIDAEPEPLELELTEIDQLAETPPLEGIRIPFILIFDGPKDRLLPEGTYQLETATGETFEFHVIPILSIGPSQQYQVVFS